MKVVFLDRDGTVIVDPPDLRVDNMKKIKLFPDSIEALKYLSQNGYGIVFITNQASIAEGHLTEEQSWNIHHEVLRRLSPSGADIIKTYMNGEAASPAASGWRKPGPKMLLQAAEDLNLNLKDIYMVGDSESDIQAATNAGCKGGILVETATGKKVTAPGAAYSAPHLLDAVHYVVATLVTA